MSSSDHSSADSGAQPYGLPQQFDVQKIPFETERYDVMQGAERWSVNVDGQSGIVAMVDVMPRLVPVGQTADFAVVQSARVSYGVGTKKVSEDESLVRYLLRHRHTTPFEQCEVKFHIVMPIFVCRQWIRHRTANVNEYSGRYSVIPDRFFRPSTEDIMLQSSTNRQGRDGTVEEKTAQEFLEYLDEVERLYSRYDSLLQQGLAREQARIGLPVNIYTEMYWKIDLHNLMHFLSLRMDEHAQLEIRRFACAMHTLVEGIFPISMKAFRDYRTESISLTRLEIEAIRTGQLEIASSNKREQAEWEEKRARLGLDSV